MPARQPTGRKERPRLDEKKLCPFKFTTRDEIPSTCDESRCAFWHKWAKECSVLVLANTFTLYQKFGFGAKKPGESGKEKKEDF